MKKLWHHSLVLVVLINLISVGCSAGGGGDGADGGIEQDGAVGQDGDGQGAAGNGGGAGTGTAGGGAGEDGADGENGAAGEDGAPGIPDQMGVTDPDWVVPDELKLCGDRPCQCANGIDDDGDGLADGFDMECTGPLDDDEGSFATGIPGDNRDPKWQDCFFDGDSGAGNDGCRYPTECLTGELDQDDPACQLTQECIEYCQPRTPSGCDCFGCCTILRDDGTTIDVIIGGDCSEENLDECQPCVPTDDCSNECGECELCPGKTIEDLPDHCWPDDTPPADGGTGTPPGGGTGGEDGSSGGGGVPYSCDNGAQTCLSSADCPSDHYCLQGCCRAIIE